MNKEISEKAHLRSDFRKKEYLLEWGSNPRKYYIFRAEIEKFFVRFLVQVKISTSPFEINWPLKHVQIKSHCLIWRRFELQAPPPLCAHCKLVRNYKSAEYYSLYTHSKIVCSMYAVLHGSPCHYCIGMRRRFFLKRQVRPLLHTY